MTEIGCQMENRSLDMYFGVQQNRKSFPLLLSFLAACFASIFWNFVIYCAVRNWLRLEELIIEAVWSSANWGVLTQMSFVRPASALERRKLVSVLQILVTTIISNLKLLKLLTDYNLFNSAVFGSVSLWTSVIVGAPLLSETPSEHQPAQSPQQAGPFLPFQRVFFFKKTSSLQKAGCWRQMSGRKGN